MSYQEETVCKLVEYWSYSVQKTLWIFSKCFGFVLSYYWSFCDPTLEAHEKAVQMAAAWWKKSPLCLPLFEGPWKSILTGHLQQEEDLLLPSSVQTESEFF
jgi:hypothetical protein